MDKTIDVIIEGGKATAGPPLGPALGPLGVNAGQVVAKINESTKDFAGMKVPVKVIVNIKTKEFKIDVGTPPTGEIIKKEAGIEKGAGSKEAKAGNITLDKVVKIAKQKNNSLGKNLKSVVKEIIGTCVSMGVTIDGKDAKQTLKDISKGMRDSELKG